MNTELLFTIAGLALLDMLSPATISVTVYILLTEQKQVTNRLFLYFATVAGVYVTIGISLVIGMDVLFDMATNILQNKIISWGIFSIGACLFITSFFMPEKKSSKELKPKSTTILAMIPLGLTTSLLEVGTALPYFTAIGMLTAAHVPWGESLLLIIGYNVIMILPPILLLIFHRLFHKSMQRPLEKIRKKLSNQKSSTLSWVMCIVGIILIFTSLDYIDG